MNNKLSANVGNCVEEVKYFSLFRMPAEIYTYLYTTSFIALLFSKKNKMQ